MSQPEASSGASDIIEDHWSFRMTPPAVHPYLRLSRFDRPIGVWLLFWPGAWSLSMAAAAEGRPPDLRLLSLFAAGSLVMRAAGCVINDLWDRDLDGRVARTALRPLPSGQVTPRQALLFLGALLLAGFVILLQLTPLAIWLGVASLALVVAYPLMKRITYWPQAFLGLTFNWGALLGWAAATGELAWPALLLYLGGIAWTLGYDTIYAHQDREDDALIGIKSAALKLGDRSKPWIAGFYAVAVLLMAAAGGAAGLGWVFWLAVAGVALQVAWQVSTLDIDAPANCLRRFKSNHHFGALLWLGIALSSLAAS